MSLDPQQAWVTWDHDGFLIGTPAGLQSVKEHIEVAIEHGQSLAREDIDFEDFAGVRVEEAPPEIPRETLSQKVAGFGCFVFGLLLLVSCVVGLWTIVRWAIF